MSTWAYELEVTKLPTKLLKSTTAMLGKLIIIIRAVSFFFPFSEPVLTGFIPETKFFFMIEGAQTSAYSHFCQAKLLIYGFFCCSIEAFLFLCICVCMCACVFCLFAFEFFNLKCSSIKTLKNDKINIYIYFKKERRRPNLFTEQINTVRNSARTHWKEQ